ncbi:MAG: hydrogenase iron-sulfur subunit [Candidatus Aminicenantales bacterium]
MKNVTFEPQIVGFLCNWCTYVAADLAGVARLQYPPNVRAIRMMCSGAVSPLYIISALKKGADGVFIGGCHIGDCHYQRGNHSTLKRVAIVKHLLEALGIDPRRLRLEWISASEGPQFSKVLAEFVSQIKELGPNPLKGM